MKRKLPLDPERAHRRAQLRRDVKLMRALGVFVWEGVTLGPEPPPPIKELTPEQIEQRIRERLEERERVQFASSSVRPRRIG